jgi:hypothetical protein
MRRIAASVLAVNAAYLIGVHNGGARVVSAVGCVSALVLLLTGSDEPAPAAWPIVPAAFVLPILAFVGPLSLALWHADVRGLLIVAWLVTISWLLWTFHGRSEPRTRVAHSRSVVVLFIVWS